MNSIRSHRLPPQTGHPSTTASIMADVLVALIPALAMSVFFFGLRPLGLTAVAIAACVGTEYLYRRLTHQSGTIRDLSACVTGMLLAMSLPASSSYLMPVLGSVFAIVLVKQFYGGLGKNFMNPALAGRMLLGTFPILMTSWSKPLDRLPLTQVDVVSAPTPMSYLHSGTLPPNSVSELLLGNQGGCLGEVSAFMLLLGGIYLVLRRVISLRIPLSYLGTVALFSLLFPAAGVNPLDWMLAQLFSGGLMLGAFFFATDPCTSPITPRGQTMFGIGCGLLTMLLRYYSSYPEGVGWAILTMNCCVWLLDRAGMPRRFGVKPFTVFRKWVSRLNRHRQSIHFVKPDLSLFRDGKAPGEEHLDEIRANTRSVLCLSATVLVMCLVIFGVRRYTEMDTVRTEAQQQRTLLAQVMPEAYFSSETPYRAAGALSIRAGYSENSELLGYCIDVQTQGFSGPITMQVGIDLDGKVTGVAIIDHKESSGIGTLAMTPEALKRYVGKSGTLHTSGIHAVDVVAGATATSKSIITGINRALAIVANLDTEGGDVDYVEGDV